MKKLFIFDWDDTLFPTSWLTQNNSTVILNSIINNQLNVSNLNKTMIDLNYTQTSLNTILYYIDNTICNLFITIKKKLNGNILIITNAKKIWLLNCLVFLPNLRQLYYNNIFYIISAQDKYSDQYSNGMMWKTLTYQDIIPYINQHHIVYNIGDDEYEFEALKNLRKSPSFNNKIQYFHYRLQKNPEFTVLMTEIQNLRFIFLNK